jgi:predicted nucleic acid-binding protein
VTALDASVLIAHFSKWDAHHDAARALLSNAATPLLAHPLTVAEVLVGPVRAGLGERMLADLQRMGVQITSHHMDPLRLAQLRATTGLRLPDCCVVDTAMRSAAPVATFDATLAGAARRLSVTVVP